MTPNSLSWLMNDFRDRTEGVEHALLFSRDGLKLHWDDGLDPDPEADPVVRDRVEYLAAIGSGIAGLAAEASDKLDCGGSPDYITLLFPERQLLLVNAGHGAVLTALAAADAEPGLVGAEMVRLIDRLSEHLGIAPRQSGAPS
ncbi:MULTISPECIES: roadblock/LC7 domain-containing protein [Streptomyces]|uniref:Roadblock/LC7 domain-containing protein n=1 Tax=Streptomyces lonarensis TaxID=700599 RepID=A0A7X6D190_9ACTN|nr:roadblock/LC7 domain-containing protein [Streptomyces lonarensis]NJQ06305.1 roadblock/LC7 domain-containing protein [Streptomyces lonarensis]